MGSSVLERDLSATLQLVTDTITTCLGFEVAVTNLVEGDVVSVAAVSGPDEVRDYLLGARRPIAEWQRLIELSDPWGELRFLDHRKVPREEIEEILAWIPDLPRSDDPEAWHPDDALFAPLRSSSGVLIGALSVDVPRSGRRPGPEQCQALEAFGITASLAVEHAALALAAQQERHRFRAVFDSSPVAIALVDADRRFVRVNGAYSRFLQRSEAELIGRDAQEFTHPDDRTRSRTFGERRRAQHGTEGTIEKRYVLPDGRIAWGRLHLAPLPQEGEDLMIAQVEDITAHRQAEERLRRQAEEDALTGLPNRAETLRRLEVALRADATGGRITAVFFCDVDHLKWLNDTHGHSVGDRFICEVGDRLAAAVRGCDTVGRLGGDEFVVIAPDLTDLSDALGLAERIITSVRRPWRCGSNTFTPSISVGVAHATGGGLSVDELLSRADLAMYRAKTEERGSWHLWEDRQTAHLLPDLTLLADLPRALEQGELALYHQPIVRLSDREVVGTEALLRWHHPILGLLTPDRFIDLVINSEHEGAVTDWVIDRACQHVAEGRAPGQPVHVNVSSVQVARRDLPDVVLAALRRWELPPSSLVLELTEDRLLSRPDGPERLAALRRIGVGVALDDFGSGFSGLQYLARFEAVTCLKLDRSFVADLDSTPHAEKVLRATVSLAEDLGLTLVVEGVETPEQAARIGALGVHLAQGYLFGRPSPARAPRRSYEVGGAPLLAAAESSVVPPAGFEPATHGLGNRRSIP